MIRSLLAVTAGAASLAALAYARYVEPEIVALTRLRVALPRLDPAFAGYRIAHLTDIHFNGWMDADRLNAIVDQANAARPDLIALTGDFVTVRRPYDCEALSAALARLDAPDGVFAVLGNHDHRHASGPAGIRRLLREAGVRELRNDVVTLRRGMARLHIAGVDDLIFHQTRLDRVLAQLPDDSAAVLLAHEPDLADLSARSGRFGLQLSGHSHGGQIRLPLLGAPLLPNHGTRYPAGLYQVGGMALYTNRGLGVGGLRLRFNCPPEIALITLNTAPNGQ